MIYVIKSSGEKEEYDAEKIHEKTLLAAEGLSGVSASDVEMNAGLKIKNGTKTKDIHKELIESASELISEDAPNYEYMAARLLNQQLRKEVYNKYDPNDFLTEVKKRIKKGFYDDSILKSYTEEEISYFGSKIRFSRDDTFTYTGLKQVYSKYLIKNNGVCIETPQEIFMLMPMYIFQNYEKKERKKWVLEGYRILSTYEVSLPTPVMNGLRSTYKRFISCNLINAGDTTKSIALANAFIMMMTANKSGIGVNTGYIRGLGADIGNGRITHTGLLPILKSYEKSTGAFTQMSRGGASTNYYPFFHYEIEMVIELGNAKGTEETRVRHADHAVLLDNLLFERYLNNENITLFHINEVPDLIDAMGTPEFKEMYVKYEKTVSKKHKKVIKAKDFVENFLTNRFLQGRLYVMSANNVHNQGMWKIPITMSNLCLEITVPSTPLDGSKGKPEVGVCILAALQHGRLTDERVPIASEFAVRFLDEMIDYMDYSHEELEYAAKKRRTIGIGNSDVFHFMAKNKEFYNTKSGRNLIHDRVELASYYMHKTSIQLAKEKGACELLDDTYYADGLFPIDRYNKNVDELVSEEQIKLKQDWEGLREELKKYGQRHSTLTANMPCGNSAKVGNATSGIEPPRFLATTKEDKEVKVTQLVPSYTKYKNYYTTAWGDDFNNEDYFKFTGVIQKFTDQSSSLNEYNNLNNYENNKVPMDVLFNNLWTALKYGAKTMYYSNTRNSNQIDGLEEEEKEEGCGSGGCVV